MKRGAGFKENGQVYFNHCAHVLNKSFKGFTGGKDIRKENFPKSEKSGGASLNKVARQLYGTAALPSELFRSSHFSFFGFWSLLATKL